MCKAGAAWSLPQLYDTGAPHLVPLNKSKFVKPEVPRGWMKTFCMV